MSGRKDLLQLIESHFNFQDFFENAVQGILHIDQQGRISAVDPAVSALFGYEPSQLAGRRITDLLPGFDPDRPAVRQEGIARDGRRLDLAVHIRPLEGGNDVRYTLLLQESARAGNSFLLYDHLFNGLPQGLVIIDLDSRQLLFANDRFLAMLGYEKRDDLSDLLLNDLCPPKQPDGRDTASLLAEQLSEVRASGSRQFELAFNHRNGRLLFSDLSATLLRPFRRPLALLLLRDVSPLRQAALDLTESRQTLEAVIKTAVDGIIIIDEQGVIQLINQAALSLFGYEREALIGQNIKMLMPEPHHSRHDEYLHRYRQHGDARIIGVGREVRGRRKDGTTFPFRLGVSEVQLSNKRLFTGVIHDLTEQKASEAKILRLNKELENKVEERTEKLTEVVNKLLQSNLKLEHEVKERKAAEEALLVSEAELRKSLEKEKELSELKSRFVSMASHEFRTPLTTIASSTELIGLYPREDQQAKRAKHLHRIQTAVTNLTAILGDFLSLSRLEEGKIQMTPKKFALKEVCDEVVEQLMGMRKPNQKIETDLGNCESELYLDKKMLKNILTNLLSNAIKYSPDNARIQVRARIEDKDLVVDVIDEGIGIPKEDQKHLFSRFFRAHNAGNVQGTGLGLNIVKRYLDLMAGSISFVSEEGKGTTFTIRVPQRIDIP